MIILKMNNSIESAPFKSNSERFPEGKEHSPGPAYYSK